MGEYDTNKGAIDGSNVPRHIAISMDGNGRWGKARLLSRIDGHKEGQTEQRIDFDKLEGYLDGFLS